MPIFQQLAEQACTEPVSSQFPEAVVSQLNLIYAYQNPHQNQPVHLKFTVTCIKKDLTAMPFERNQDYKITPLGNSGLKPDAKEQRTGWEIPQNLEIKQLQKTQVK